MSAEPRAVGDFNIHYLTAAGTGDHHGSAPDLASAISLAAAFFVAREQAAVSTALCVGVLDATGIVAWIGHWPYGAQAELQEEE